MRGKQIKAVHQSDFEKLLTSLGIYDEVHSCKERCYFCHETVSKDNIAAVFPVGELVCFCCQKKECYAALIELTRDGGSVG